MRQLVVLWLLLWAAAVAQAAPVEGQAAYRVNKAIEGYVLNADATYTDTMTVSMTVLSEKGITALNQADLSYSSSLSSVDVLFAYTLKKDGSRVDVPAINIQDRDVVAGGGPMYSDFKGKVIVFPSLEVGDSVVYSVREVQRVPMFPGQFSLMAPFTRDELVDDQEIDISAPLSLPLQAVASAGVEGGHVDDVGGRAHWHWQWHNAAVAAPGDALPEDEQPQLLVTSFRDFGALAAAYAARALPQAAVTPKIQAEADALTLGLTRPEDQARALYAWVAHNIRYAGNCIGVGSVAPHAADRVLDNRLGDCKDHTALLGALLAAKGIASTPVLVNSGGRYVAPALPVPEYFNHVINYIPSLKVYADSTADLIPFGMLPFGEAAKVALPVVDFAGLVKTPMLGWQDYAATMNYRVQLAADGSESGGVEVAETLLAAVGAREYFAQHDNDDEEQRVQKSFEQAGLGEEGWAHHDDPRAGTDPYRFGISFTAKNAFDAGSAGALTVSSLYNDSMPIASWVNMAVAPPFRHGYACMGGHSVEDYQYQLPVGMKILWLPHDVHVSAGQASYDAVYRQSGLTVSVRRELQYRADSHLCTPAEAEGIRPVAAAIAKDLRARILYQMD